MKYELYCIKNKVNGLRYIGITTKGVRRRYTNHLCSANKKVNRPLYDSMNKFGIENFEIEFVKETKDLNQLKEMEVSYIVKYNTFFFDEDSKGYNCTRGGEGTWGIEGEIHHMYGKNHSKETKELISKKLKGENHPQYGKKGFKSVSWGREFSEETREKIRDKLKGRVFSDESKKKMSESRKGYVTPQETRDKISKKMKEVQLNKSEDSFMSMVEKCQENAHNKRSCEIITDTEKVKFTSVMECARYVKTKFDLTQSLNAISKTLRRRIDTDKMCYEKFYIVYK